MRRVSPLESNVPCVLPQRAVNDIGVQGSACLQAFAITSHRPKEWSLDILAMPCHREIIADALRRLGVNSQTPLLAAFAHDLQGIEAAVHVEVSDVQSGDLCAAKPDLQTNGQHGPVTNTEQRAGIRLIKNSPSLRLGERQRHPLSAVHDRPLDMAQI